MRWSGRLRSGLFFVGVVLSVAPVGAETCLTQSQMQPADRDALATVSQSLALKIQSNDALGIKNATIPQFVTNFNGIERAIASVAPNLRGDTPEVEQVYVLDATANKPNPDGSAPGAEFICTLNKGNNEADFSIDSLPPGRYGFAIVVMTGASPWQISMLLRQDGAGTPWKLAGFFPKETVAAGHDGLWYWSQGRATAAKKQSWLAYLDYQEAKELLQPAGFVSSTHLENLRVESSAAAPPEAANGIDPETPLIIKGADGKEYRFTSVAPDDSLHKEKLDIALHLIADPSIIDPLSIRARNLAAMSAWLGLHPELRESFHGMWVFADAPGRAPVATEAAMNEIR
jgi:hypothetical protein